MILIFVMAEIVEKFKLYFKEHLIKIIMTEIELAPD